MGDLLPAAWLARGCNPLALLRARRDWPCRRAPAEKGQDQAGQAGLAAQHKQLLRAIDEMGRAVETDSRSRRYFYEYLEHLAGAGHRRSLTLDALLFDRGFRTATSDRTVAVGSPDCSG
jgi:hypothetical protein